MRQGCSALVPRLLPACVAVLMAASLLSSCLCAPEEQFILSQVALLEQVNSLVPVLDSASIKGTPVGLLGRWLVGPRLPCTSAGSAP